MFTGEEHENRLLDLFKEMRDSGDVIDSDMEWEADCLMVDAMSEMTMDEAVEKVREFISDNQPISKPTS